MCKSKQAMTMNDTFADMRTELTISCWSPCWCCCCWVRTIWQGVQKKGKFGFNEPPLHSLTFRTSLLNSSVHLQLSSTICTLNPLTATVSHDLKSIISIHPQPTPISQLTPIMAFSSGTVICFALSTACSTCCWCSCAKNGNSWLISAFNRFTISVWK